MKRFNPRAGMARPGWDDEEDCRAVLRVLDRIGDKWTVMAVGALADGPVRFNAMLRLTGASHRMLTLTLRSLEGDGLVKRTAYATIPPRVEYELTKLGLSLIQPLKAMAVWAKRNRRAMEAARVKFEAERTGSRPPQVTALSGHMDRRRLR